MPPPGTPPTSASWSCRNVSPTLSTDANGGTVTVPVSPDCLDATITTNAASPMYPGNGGMVNCDYTGTFKGKGMHW